ncbi:Uncharacterized protein QTN25_008140 [Entamoeba marina]
MSDTQLPKVFVPLNLPPLLVKPVIINSEIKHSPFSSKVIQTQTIEERQQNEAHATFYSVYYQIEQLEKYGEYGIISVEQYTQHISELLQELMKIKSSKHGKDIENIMNGYVKIFPRASKRITSHSEGKSSSKDILKSIITTPIEFTTIEAFQRHLFKLLHLTTDMEKKETTKIQKEMNEMINKGRIGTKEEMKHLNQQLLEVTK